MTSTNGFRPIVAHVCDKFLPVSETFIYQSLQNIRRAHPIAVYSTRDNAQLFPMAPDGLYEVPYPSRFSLQRIQALLLRKTGFDPAADTMATSYQRAFTHLKPALVHAHFGPQGCRVVQATTRLKIPLLVSYYGYDLSSLLLEERWVRAYQAMFGRIAGIIALSEDFKQRLIKLGCPDEKIHIIRLGVDPDTFTYRQPPSTLPNPIRLLGVGRCVEKKAGTDTLSALAIVRKQFPDITYTHIGDGPLLDVWKAHAASLGLSDICDWQGSRPRDVVRQAMHASHLFILPSVRAKNGDEEGTPTVLYEAMAIGLPILSTLHSGIPEVVQDGGNGYLSPERDIEALAHNIFKMIDNVAQWPNMAEIGRRRIETEFDVRNETSKLEDLYFSIL